MTLKLIIHSELIIFLCIILDKMNQSKEKSKDNLENNLDIKKLSSYSLMKDLIKKHQKSK